MKVIERRSNGTKRVVTINNEPSRTQQQFKDDVNINKIMAKYKKTGMIKHINPNSGVYADMTNIGSYQEAMETVINAQNAFQDLPSNIRAKFQNNPQELINFLKDPRNDDEAINLGLRVKPKPIESVEKSSQKETKKEKINETKD